MGSVGRRRTRTRRMKRGEREEDYREYGEEKN